MSKCWQTVDQSIVKLPLQVHFVAGAESQRGLVAALRDAANDLEDTSDKALARGIDQGGGSSRWQNEWEAGPRDWMQAEPDDEDWMEAEPDDEETQ